MTDSQSQSAALYERAQRVMPGGCSRNTILRDPHPYYAAHAKGCYVTDIEGVSRIDFANNMAALIHGHAHPEVTEAVSKQLSRGTAFTFGTEVEIDYAELICSRSPQFEKMRFVNSGTEAVMSCLKAARAFTGKPKIAKIEGAYHGLYDFAEVSQTSGPANWGDISRPKSVPVAHGTTQGTLDDVVVLPFNNPELALSILDEHRHDIACVLIDFMPHRAGVITANADFIEQLFAWTRANDSLFVADEVITFRSEYAGLQQRYNIKPDLTAMGKMIGGGFPVGALAGRGDVMEVMNPRASKVLFPHSGTFSANPVTMTAGLTALRLYDQKAVARLNSLADYAKTLLNEVIKTADVPACVTGTGSMFKIHLLATPPTHYREAFATPAQSKALAMFMDHMYDNGVIMIYSGSATLSTAMTKKEIERFAEAVQSGLQKVRPILLGETS